MALELKPITKEGVPTALEKAQRYRLLNEPVAAESICLDVLTVDPDNQQALVGLVLSITDQFDDEMSAGVRRAREVLSRVRDEYKRNYYGGIVCERYAVALLRHGALRAAESAYGWFRDAMEWYEKAEAIRSPGNDESILRWNTCARILARDPTIAPAPAEKYEPSFD
jgi:hypothetical protein